MKEGPFIIHHSGGKCVSIDSIDRLYLSSRCATGFALTVGNAVVEMASGKCVVPESDSDNAFLKLQSNCNDLRASFKQTSLSSVQHLSTGKCWHPLNGPPNPAEGTFVLLHTGCNVDRLAFKFETGNFIFLHHCSFLLFTQYPATAGGQILYQRLKFGIEACLTCYVKAWSVQYKVVMIAGYVYEIFSTADLKAVTSLVASISCERSIPVIITTIWRPSHMWRA